MRRRTILLTALTALLALAWAAAPAHAVQLAPPAPHSPNAEVIHSSYIVMVVITIALIVIVNAALIVAVVRFRERRGRHPARFAAGRGALRPVIGVLAAVALAIFIFGVIRTNDARQIEPSGPDGLSAAPTAQVGVKGLPPIGLAEEGQAAASSTPGSTTDPANASPLEINAIAQQWLWRFEYPGGRPGQRVFSYGELVVPVDTPVILNITSTDVLHGWWVPALGGQVQATPGQISQTWFKADQVGRYSGSSTIFSGTSFPSMRAWVRVVTVPEYQAYLEQLKSGLDRSQGIIFGDQQGGDAG